MLAYFIKFHNMDPISDTGKILGVIGLMMIYYRAFSHFRIINSFTSLVDMVNVIIVRLFVFFFILFYFFITTSLLITFLNPEGFKDESFIYSYIWAIFGGVEGGDFENFRFAAIPIAFGTLIVMIVLLNILIGLLSSIYCALENQQKSNDIRQKASMLLDLEVIVHFFKYAIKGKLKQIEKFDQYQSLNHFRLVKYDVKTFKVCEVYLLI